ncbi:MAG: HD domain-containing protein [Acholeplasmataceae bacterium]|nr:MAG: HD domain-containing protein [Acholeplasmataceae bacterium]
MIDAIRKRVVDKLKNDPGRLGHVQGVVDTALKLAGIHDVDLEKTAMAAWYHDIMKNDDVNDQTALLDDTIIKRYADMPVQYHAHAAAVALERDFNIRDPEVLDAIRHHVWGRAGMGRLEQIIFVADLCEPGRGFIDTEALYQLATKNLDNAVLMAMKIIIDHLNQSGLRPHPEQLEAYHHYQKEE